MGSVAADAASTVACRVQRALDVRLELSAATMSGAQLAGWHARARAGGDGRVEGFAARGSREEAGAIATIELAERWAQFTQAAAPVVARDSAAALGDAALGPGVLECYSATQYCTPGFGLARFEEATQLDWTPVIRVRDGVERLVPLEFVHPAAVSERARVVAETSSGTAAHTDPDGARLAAVCELVERDAALMLWHRRVGARRIAVGSVDDDAARSTLVAIQGSGNVIVLLALGSDVDLPVVLACALRPDGRFRHGLGCAPDASVALARAVRELAQRVCAHGDSAAARVLSGGAHRATYPADHVALYDQGPLHDAIRHTLDSVAVAASPPLAPAGCAGNDAEDLATVVTALAARGYETYACDIAPPQLAGSGLHVVKAIVPGLVPLYFGADRIRLACRRLTGPSAPGRLSTLLPHFLG